VQELEDEIGVDLLRRVDIYIPRLVADDLAIGIRVVLPLARNWANRSCLGFLRIGMSTAYQCFLGVLALERRKSPEINMQIRYA
jgi:hypothetical protein